MTIEIRTGVGRIVWGNPARSQTKKHQDGQQKGQPVLKDGQPVQQWAFGVAFPKAEFQATIWPAMSQEATSGYPHGVPPRFSWKYQDGDGIDSKGQPFSQREGYAGCFVLTVSTEAFAPPIYKLENGAYRQMKPEEIKTGDYVVCALNIKVNVATGTNTPSLYINPVAIEHVGYGQEIQSVGAVDPTATFGGAVYQLPAGASAMPVAPVAGAGMPGTAPMMQPPMVAPGGMPGAPGGMPGMMAPPAPMAPPPPAPAPVMARPIDPSHIQPNPAGGEFWWNGAAWIAAPAQLPPPAIDFVHNAGMPGAPPMMPGAPGGMPQMPGMMPGR